MKKIIYFLWDKKWSVLLFLFVAACFFINALHESYPDEFDNISGGWFILHGKLIYNSWFTHHGPFPYFLAAFLEIFSGNSFVRFRLVYAVALLAYFFGISYLLKGRVSKISHTLFTVFIAFFSFASVYYWGQMLLADTIAALTFLPVFLVIVDKLFTQKSFTRNDLFFLSTLMACGFYSSLAYIYVLLLFSSVIIVNYYVTEWRKIRTLKDGILPLVWFALPHLVFLGYLLLTGSIKNYYFDAWVFNEKYYIFNYPREEGAGINPIRYAVLIAHNFTQAFQYILIGVKYFDFGAPMNITLAVGDAATLIYLMLKRKFRLALFVLLSLIFTTPRSDISKSKETDYQAAMYILFSYWNILWVLVHLYHACAEQIDAAKKILYGFLFLLVGVYGAFASLYLFNNFFTKAYLKYMGLAPLIYDRPERAPIINAVVTDKDYMWIGPFAFEDLFYAHGQFPSKYQILIPGMAHSDTIKAEMLQEFEKNPPKVMLFDNNFNILGNRVGDYDGFLMDFFKKDYITLLPYKDGNTVYRSVAPISVNTVDLETQLYIRKDSIHDVLTKLIAAGYIRAETVK